MILRHGKYALVALGFSVLACVFQQSEAGMYGEQVVQLDSSNFQKLVVDSTETWVVKFYAPWCGHCKSSAPAFTKAAKKLDGVAKVGVVNCDDDRELGSKYGVQGFPTIKVFKGEGKKARRPDDYSGERTATAIASHVKYVMPSFVTRVKSAGLDAFLRDEGRLPHVLLFTDKSSTSALYKGMSAEFRGLASFGEVRKADAADLLERYSVSQFPTLMAFKPDDKEGTSPFPYNGGMDPGSLREFFKVITEGVTPEEPGSEKPKEKVFTQPKAFKADVAALNSKDDYVQNCGARKDGRICGLAFLPGGMSHVLGPALSSIAKIYQYDNMAFTVVDSVGADGGGSSLATKFGIEDATKGGFVAVRSRKNKFAMHDANTELSAESIAAFLDRLLGGDARFKKLDGDLPEWEPPAKESANVDDGESETSGQCGVDPSTAGGSCGVHGDEPKIEL